MNQVSKEAERRRQNNRGNRTNKPLNPEAEELGVAGELALQWMLGIDQPKARRARTPWTYQHQSFRIKVVTSRTPRRLMVKAGKVEADVYILAGVRGDILPQNVYWVGWAHSSLVKESPIDTPRAGKGDSYAQPAHILDGDKLLPMEDLSQILGTPKDRLYRPYRDVSDASRTQAALGVEVMPEYDG